VLEVGQEVNGFITKKWDKLGVLDPDIFSHLK
jgi:hypothetical protein